MNKTEIKLEDVAKLYRNDDGTLSAEMKQKSLKLEDIIKEQIGRDVWFAEDTGLITDDVCDPDVSYIDQISQKSARKVLLFGCIQRIADYANDGWEPDWNNINQDKFSLYYDYSRKCIDVWVSGMIKRGDAVFSSQELALQAYADNKEIIDEYFSL